MELGMVLVHLIGLGMFLTWMLKDLQVEDGLDIEDLM